MTVLATTTPLRNRAQPVAVHAYIVPVVRECPPRPFAVFDSRVW
jgi:hypothetical protein